MQIRYANNSMEIAKNYRDVMKKKKKRKFDETWRVVGSPETR